MRNIDYVKTYDPELGAAIEAEFDRQRRNIELIASENIVSETVMAAMGTILPINMQKDTPERDITAAANALTLLKTLQENVHVSFSALTMQTFSPTAVRRQTWLSTLHFSSPATPSWV